MTAWNPLLLSGNRPIDKFVFVSMAKFFLAENYLKYIIFIVSMMLSIAGFAQEVRLFEPSVMSVKPEIDGDLSDWQAQEFETIPISSAIKDDEDNRIGESSVELASRIVGDRIYFAARWADSSESLVYRPWVWRGTRYRRAKIQDDKFALRFEISGEYNRSMIVNADYVVDVWVWSSARSNLIGIAEDQIHTISTSPIENAPEYESENGTIIYIDRIDDSGTPGFTATKPANRKVKTESQLASIEVAGLPEGSIADVSARGVWKDGFWTTELSRELDTGNSDDRAFRSGDRVHFQLAIFNESQEEHKSISEPALLIIP